MHSPCHLLVDTDNNTNLFHLKPLPNELLNSTDPAGGNYYIFSTTHNDLLENKDRLRVPYMTRFQAKHHRS